MTAEQHLIKRWRDLAERYESHDSDLAVMARIYRECADELEGATTGNKAEKAP